MSIEPDSSGIVARRSLAPWSVGHRLPLLLLAAVATAVGIGGIPSTQADFTAQTASVGNSFAAAEWKAIVDIAGGTEHACLVRDEGYVWCWGLNDRGQLGDNTTTDSLTPVQVVGPGGTGVLSSVAGLDAGAEHTCAVRTDETVWCWGENGDGQLGDNSSTDSSVPVQVTAPGGSGTLTAAVEVAGGLGHSCAVKSDATVWCWGRNDRGQLGDNTTSDSLTPVQVTGSGGVGTLSGVSSVAAGAKSTCVVKTDTTVWCWGDNGKGQLGDNTTTDSSAPVQVVGAGGVGTLSGALVVTAGEEFGCVAKSDGSVWCWGDNGKGQLGDNTTTDSSVPVQVTGPGGVGTLSGVSTVGAGLQHACGVKSDTTVWCWGLNDRGQLGDDTTTDSSAPVQVKGSGGVGTLSGATLVGAGDLFTCAALSDWTAWCWGRNNKGQLGDNTTTDRLTPIQVKGGGWTGFFDDAVEVAGGLGHSCAVKSDATVWCWGRNDRGQLGDNTTSDSLTPVQVTGSGGVGTLSGVSSVAAGAKSTCVVKTDTTVWCWGDNGKGQLGDNTTTDSSAPVQVVGAGGVGTLSGALVVTAGEEFGCVAKSDGSVWCWGDNGKGQLGDNTTTDSSVPVQVTGPGGVGMLSGVSTVGAGLQHACGVKSDTTVWCWGLNDKGQLGDDTTTDSLAPVQVKGSGGVGTLSGATLVGAGDLFTCAALSDWTAWCWGRNNKGQLGDNTTTDRLTPIQVVGQGGIGTFTAAVEVAGGVEHACATRSDGTVWCWGLNNKGQLGDNTTSDSPSPVQVTDHGGIGTIDDADTIGSRASHGCVVRTDQSVWCWGDNGHGQLGNGATSDSSSPTRVL